MIYGPPPKPDMGPLTMEEHAFLGSKVQSFTPQGKSPPEFNELKGQSSLGISRLSARKKGKLHAFLKANGGFALRHTQDLGNCLYAAVLRGTDCRSEFTIMHLRRMLVWMVSVKGLTIRPRLTSTESGEKSFISFISVFCVSPR